MGRTSRLDDGMTKRDEVVPGVIPMMSDEKPARRHVLRSRPVPQGGRVGFTLIEVLVVVSVIALLVAILLPSLRKAREQGKRIVCASNQKQILGGVHMYTSENKGWLPGSVPGFNASLTWIIRQEFYDGSTPPYPKRWVHLGLPYDARQIRDKKVYYCPSRREFPHVYPRGWYEYSSYHGLERVATAYVYALNGQVDRYPKGVRVTARLEELKVHEALLAGVVVGKSDKHQFPDVWAHKAGFNAGYTDGSVELKNVKGAIRLEALRLYGQNNIRLNDYFTYCYFQLLNGDRKWMDAFPNKPPGE